MLFSIEAPAKINLGLHVLRRRPDGFHDLESVFLKIGWSDSITASRSDKLTLTCSDASLPTDEANLVLQAAVRLQNAKAIHSGASIHLEKRIPCEAGLGGGSSDAAHTLLLLSRMWSVEPVEVPLFKIGASIGSDVPFFLGGAAAFVRGRGERIDPLPSYRFPFFLVVVKPPVSVSTREAYGHIRPRNENRVDLASVVLSNDPERWRSELVNDFEASVVPRYPELAELKEEIYRSGALYAAMTGSGSAIFGVFATREDASEAANRLARPDRKVWTGASVSFAEAVPVRVTEP